MNCVNSRDDLCRFKAGNEILQKGKYMSGETITCIECGQSFIWSHGEQRFYKEMNYVAPKRCKLCRTQSKYEPQPNIVPALSPTNIPSDSIGKKYAKKISKVRNSHSSGVERSKKRSRTDMNSTRQLSWWYYPKYRFGIISFGLVAISTVVIWWYGYPLDVLQSWLIAITAVTIMIYGYDKAIAHTQWMRVPEDILIALVCGGGTIGAFVGMRIFRHKIAKGEFLFKYWIVVGIQVILIIGYYLVVKPLMFGSI